MEIVWKITVEEQKKANKIRALLPIILLFSAGYLYLETSLGQFVPNDYVSIFMQALPVLVVFSLLFYTYVRLVKVQPYSYEVREDGLVVGRGSKRSEYSWNDFGALYNYSDAKKSSSLVLIGGTILFLELKKSIFGRTFVVVHVPKERAESVIDFMQQKVQRKEYTNRDDWGFKKYLHK